jgi:hypothetical protein
MRVNFSLAPAEEESMMEAVPSAAASAGPNRSVEALSELLMDSTVKNLALARKLIAAAAETAMQGIQDPFLGTRIDTSA